MTATSEIRTSNKYPALARCLAIDPEEFLNEYYGRKLLHTPAEKLTGDFSDLFSVNAVNSILSSGGLRTSSLRIVREDQQLDPRKYGRVVSGDNPGESPYVDTDRVATALRDGCSLVIRSLHRHHRPLMDFSQALSADLGYPVGINAYVTPAKSQAVKVHFDTHDVLVLQIAGEKVWEIRKPVLVDPVTDQAWQEMGAAKRSRLLARSEPLQELVLRPGDSFHLPRGFLHSARAGTETAVQLTIAIMTTTRYDLLQSLVTLAQDDPWFRQRVPLHDEDAIDLVADLIPEMTSRILGLEASAAARKIRQYVNSVRWDGVPPEPIPVLSPSNCHTYRPRVGARYSLDDHDGEISVISGARQISIPRTILPVLQEVLSSSRVDTRNPPSGTDATVWQTIIAALVRIGILTPVVDDPFRTNR